MHKYLIPKKMSNTGSIHDLASDQYDRVIKFPRGCYYAVVLASYYGGKGYTTHKTFEAAIKASKKVKDYSHCIINEIGETYFVGRRGYRDFIINDGCVR